MPCFFVKISPRFSSGLVFGVVAMLGSVVLLIKTLQQTLAQMTTDNPRMGGQQALQVVVRAGANAPDIYELRESDSAARESDRWRMLCFPGSVLLLLHSTMSQTTAEMYSGSNTRLYRSVYLSTVCRVRDELELRA